MTHDDDAVIAAWAAQQNHGIPPWHTLNETARAWWRERYHIHKKRGQSR